MSVWRSPPATVRVGADLTAAWAGTATPEAAIAPPASTRANRVDRRMTDDGKRSLQRRVDSGRNRQPWKTGGRVSVTHGCRRKCHPEADVTLLGVHVACCYNLRP